MIVENFKFSPLFRKPILIAGKRTVVELPGEQLESIIMDLAENEVLVRLMLEYIRLARQEIDSMPEQDEIALRQKIFPIFRKKIENIEPMYVVFSADVAEEMFQRIEDGKLEVSV